MQTKLKWLLAIALGVTLQSSPLWGGLGASATEADALSRPGVDRRSCTLPARICAAEVIVVITPGVDRRIVDWRRSEVVVVKLHQFRTSYFDALGSEHTVALMISSEELRSGRHSQSIEQFIDRGYAVVVANPALGDAERLKQLTRLGGAAWDVNHEALLYGVRNAFDDLGRAHTMSFVLLRDSEGGAGGLLKKPKRGSRLNEDETAWLLERIGPHPPVTLRDINIPGSQASCEGADPQSCINELAIAKHTSVKLSANADSQEIDNYIYAARSFVNQEDLYYVAQELQYTVGDCGLPLEDILVGLPTNAGTSVPISTVTQTSPGSTQETTTVTSGVNFTLGGSAGYQAGKPSFNVAPSLTFLHSSTTTVPPVLIENLTDTQTATPQWLFDATFNTSPGLDNDYTTAWIWTVKLDDYTSATQTFDFVTTSTMVTMCNFGGFEMTLRSSVDQPFPTKTIEAPVVNSVAGSPVTVGQQFQINGTGFYPSLVQNVLLQGNAVPTANISTTSDTVITVTAPNDSSHFAFNKPLAVTVRTTAGTSNSDKTVTIRAP